MEVGVKPSARRRRLPSCPSVEGRIIRGRSNSDNGAMTRKQPIPTRVQVSRQPISSIPIWSNGGHIVPAR